MKKLNIFLLIGNVLKNLLIICVQISSIDTFHLKYSTLAKKFVNRSLHGKSSDFFHTENLYEDGFPVNGMRLKNIGCKLIMNLQDYFKVSKKIRQTLHHHRDK